MGRLWDPERRFAVWLEWSFSPARRGKNWGKIEKGTAGRIRRRLSKSPLSIRRIDAIEKEVKHDVIAFLTHVAERGGPGRRDGFTWE